MLLKNIAGQGMYLYSYDTINKVPKTGDAANTTGSYALDGTNTNGFSTANPTEMGGGIYWQPLAQAETNGNAFSYRWASSTSGVQINPVVGLTTGVSLPVAAPGAAGGIFIAGTNAATTVTTSFTTTFTGNVTGSVGSVSGVTFPSGFSALTVAAIATGIWTDTTSGDFATTSSPGKILVNQMGSTFTNTSSSIFSSAALANTPGSSLTLSAIATAVWQDTTSGDFTVSGSIGKSVFTAGAAPGATGGLVIAGSNAATTFATLTSTGLFTTNGVVAVAQTGDNFAKLGTPAGASVSADIAGVLAQVTPPATIGIWPFIMVLTDHFTRAPSKTVTAMKSVDGAAFVPCTNTVQEMANGWYYIDLTSADLTCTSSVALDFSAPGCDSLGTTVLKNS